LFKSLETLKNDHSQKKNNVIKKYTDTVQNCVLRPDEPRFHLNYVRWLDYNGKREIANSDGTNVVEDGDYAMIHFY
jgi:hypothetical protein